MKKEWLSIVVVLFIAVCITPLSAWAGLENPTPESVKSGIGVVSGWVCAAEELEVSFDNGPRLFVPYGSDRADTTPVCGDADNGFSMLMNYNNLGDGEHTITLYVDGQVETTRAFFVGTFGGPFLQGVNGRGRVALSGGQSVVVQWSEAIQGFEIVGYAHVPGIRALGNLLGAWHFVGDDDGLTFTKDYRLTEMETNMTHEGIIALAGHDIEDNRPIFLIPVDNLLPGSSLPYDLALSDSHEINTTGGQQLCVLYVFNEVDSNRLEGRAFFQGKSELGCQAGTLGNPDGYLFTATRTQ